MAHIVKLSLDGPQSAFHLGRFEAWLRKSSSLDDGVSLRLVDDESSGALGGAEYIEIVCEVLSTVAAIVSTYVAWKLSRRDTPELVIVIDQRPAVRVLDGSAVEIDSLGLESADAADDGDSDGDDRADGGHGAAPA